MMSPRYLPNDRLPSAYQISPRCHLKNRILVLNRLRFTRLWRADKGRGGAAFSSIAGKRVTNPAIGGRAKDIFEVASKKKPRHVDQRVTGLGRGDNQIGILYSNAYEYYLLKKTPATDRSKISNISTGI